MREDYNIYEYLSKDVKIDLEENYINCYSNFGWIPINNNGKRDYYLNSNPNPYFVNITFKRSRRISQKDELQKLQKECENAIKEIDKLEKMPNSIGMVYSLTVGVLASICIAICIYSLFFCESIIWPLVIIFGMIGIIGIVLPYFIYKKIKEDKEIENKSKIKKAEEIIFDTCDKARKILSE